MQAAQRAQSSLNAFQPSSSASTSSKQPTPGNSGTQDWSGVHRPDSSIPGAPSLAAQGSGVFAQQASTNLQQPPSSHHTPANVPPPLRQAHSLKPCATDCPKSAPVLVCMVHNLKMQIRHIIASNPSGSHVWLLAHRAAVKQLVVCKPVYRPAAAKTKAIVFRQAAYPQPQQTSSFAYSNRPSMSSAHSGGLSHQPSLSHQQVAMVSFLPFFLVWSPH